MLLGFRERRPDCRDGGSGSDVSPLQSADDLRDLGGMNIKPLGQLLLVKLAGRVEGAHLDNLRFRQLATRALTAFCGAALRHHIGGVVGIGSNPEVSGVDTSRGIARMANLLALWSGTPVVKLPRDTMGASRLPSGCPVKSAVSVRTGGSGPDPAVSRLIHLGPETFQERTAAIEVDAAPTAKLPKPSGNLVERCIERTAAASAGAGNCSRMGAHREVFLSDATGWAVSAAPPFHVCQP